MTGSLQLRDYLAHRAAGKDRAEAAGLVGMSAEEARLTDIANERGEIELAPWPRDHNQTKEKTVAEGTVAADELRLLIERVERLEGEKKAIADDIKDVYLEAKSRGYDTKALRRIVALRKIEQRVLQESAAILDTYASALGMQLSFL